MHRRTRTCLSLVLTSLPALARADAGAPVDATTWSRRGVTTSFEPAPGDRGSFPVASAIDIVDDEGRDKRVFVGVSQNADDPHAALVATFLVSDDGGGTFVGTQTHVGPWGVALGRRLDGALVDIGFVVLAIAGDHASLDGHVSFDAGASWEPLVAELVADAPIGGMRIHRGMTVLPDGTLLVPSYLAYQGEPGFGVRLLQSTDGGSSWTVRGSVAVPTTALRFNETAISPTVDGALIAVMRTDTGSGNGPLVQTRSDDDGVTWSTPTELQVAFDGQAAGPRVGVDPALLLLPNGVLVLSAGREDNWLAVSPDGTGDAWEQAAITYVNHPTTPAGALRTHGSSGYTALVPLASNRLLLVGDNCANSWGCPADEGGWTTDDRYRIWQAVVDVLGPDPGRLDLAGAWAEGAVELGGTMTWTSVDHPEIGIDAVLDGSVEPWSAAIADADAGELVLRLDRIHELTRVGVAVRPGVGGTAEIQVSDDGASWGDPIASFASSPGRALAYVDLDPPRRAGWVRVVPGAQADCGPALAQPCTMLGELELYSTLDGFENDAVGRPPRGYVDTALAEVAELGHGHALRITDDAADTHARVARDVDPSPVATLEFRMRAEALPNALLVDVRGQTAAGESQPAYHLAIGSDGAIDRYDTASATWLAATPPGTVALADWTTVRIVAGLSDATICVDEAPVATVAPSTPGITALLGHGFASAGTAPVGDDVWIDDVLFDDRMRDCTIERPRDPPAGGDTSGGVAPTEGGEAGEGGAPAGEGSSTGGASGGGAANEAAAHGCGCHGAGSRGHGLVLVAVVLGVRRRRPRTR